MTDRTQPDQLRTLLAAVLRWAAREHESDWPYSVEDDDLVYVGTYCEACAAGVAEECGGTYIMDTDSSDGPAYCDVCERALDMRLTEYGIDTELMLCDDPEHWPLTSPRDASIALGIAGQWRDLTDRQRERLVAIAAATMEHFAREPKP